MPKDVEGIKQQTLAVDILPVIKEAQQSHVLRHGDIKDTDSTAVDD